MDKDKQDKLIKKIIVQCNTEKFDVKQTDETITIVGSKSMGHHFTTNLYKIVNKHRLMCFVIVYSNKINFVIHW